MKLQYKQLLEDLYRAFRENAPPTKAQISDCDRVPCSDCDHMRDLFADRDITAISDDIMIEAQHGLSFLSPKAFRYFLPRFVEFALNYPDEIGRETVIFSLQDNETSQSGVSSQRLQPMTAEQRNAIRMMLIYFANHAEDDIELENIQKALNYFSS